MILPKNNIFLKSGDFFLPLKTKLFLDKLILGTRKSLIYLNNWSIIHFLSGIFLFHIIKYLNNNKTSNTNILIIGFTVHLLWELWQIIIHMTPFQTLRGQIDIIVDTILFMLGMIMSLIF